MIVASSTSVRISTRLVPWAARPDDDWEVPMDVIVERCAGLDVHKRSVMATVRVPTGVADGLRRPAS